MHSIDFGFLKVRRGGPNRLGDWIKYFRDTEDQGQGLITGDKIDSLNMMPDG